MVKRNPWTFWLGLGTGVVLGFLVRTAVGQNPAMELKSALADMERLPPAQWKSTRYLTTYNLDASKLTTHHRVAGFVLNSLSRTAQIVNEPQREGFACR